MEPYKIRVLKMLKNNEGKMFQLNSKKGKMTIFL